MARPQKSPEERRTQQVNVALSPVEIAALQSKADEAKTTVTAFVRASALNKRVTVKKSDAPDFMTRNELRRIGVNLNQIARALNEGRGHVPEDLSNVCNQLEALFDRWLDHGSQDRKIRL